MMIDGHTANLQPYPGLRPFQREELHLFFGRKDCLHEMVETIIGEDRFLAVLGASGSGKSSLVRTGFFSALFAGYAGQAGTRWQVADIAHPGETTPFCELAKSLIHSSKAGLDPDQPRGELDKAEVDRLSAYLQRGPMSLVEWAKSGNIGLDTNLLILVDQFEELFRYKRDAGAEGEFDRDHIERFVNLLLQSARTGDANIYVVMTMRAEFLNVCTTVPGLAERLSKNMVVPPRMSRDECELAIKGPQRVLESLKSPNAFRIDDDLVEDILNDMEALAPWERSEAEVDQVERLARRADQLPLMQHALNRLWHTAHRAREGEGAEIRLTRKAYRDMGRLTGALDEHGDQIMKDWSDARKETAGRVFRTLVDGSSVDKAVRRPRTIPQIVDETQESHEEVRFVVNAFRAKEINFLTPFGDKPIDDRTMIDISHESLIRQWSMFRGWFQTEAAAGRTWAELKRKRDDDEERRKKAEPERLLDSLAWSDAERWWKRDRPSPGWAERYGGGYAEVEAYLVRSRRRLDRRRLRSLTGAAFVALAIAGLSVVGVTSNAAAQEEAERARVASYRARDLALASEKIATERQRRAETEARRARGAEKRALSAEESAKAQKRVADQAVRTAAAMRTAALAAQASAQTSEVRAKDAQTRVAVAKQAALELFQGHASRLTAEAFRDTSGDRRLRALQAQYVSLLDSDDARAKSLVVAIESAIGEIGWAKFDESMTLDVARKLEKLPAVTTAEAPDARARAAIWKARTDLLAGRPREAAALAAAASADEEVSDATRMEASLWTGEAHLAAGERDSALLSARRCRDLGRRASEPAGEEVKRIGAQCDALLGYLVPDAAEADRLFAEAVETLRALPDSQQGPLTVRALVGAYIRRGDRMIAQPDAEEVDGQPLSRPYSTANAVMRTYVDSFGSDRGLLRFNGSSSGLGTSMGPAGAENSNLSALDRFLAAEAAIKWVGELEFTAAADSSIYRGVANYVDRQRKTIPPVKPSGGPYPGEAERRLFAIYREFPRFLQRAGANTGKVNYPGFGLLFSKMLEGTAYRNEFVRTYPAGLDAATIAETRDGSTYVADLLAQPGFGASFLTYPNIVEAEPAKLPEIIERFCASHQALVGRDGELCRANFRKHEPELAKAAKFAERIAAGPQSEPQPAAGSDKAEIVEVEPDLYDVALAGLDPIACAQKLAEPKASKSLPASTDEMDFDTLFGDPPCGREMMGRPDFIEDWAGLFWLFSSEENLQRFRADPSSYAKQLRNVNLPY